MNLMVNLNSLEYIYDYKSIGVQYFVVGAPAFSCRQAMTLSYEEIKALKEQNVHVYVLVNALVEEKNLSALKEHIDMLYTIHVDGLLFQDLGVLQYCKEQNYAFDMIYSPDTLNTNPATLAFLKSQGITGAFLAREIPLTEKQDIALKCDLSTVVQVHGVEYMAYSKRKLLSNYKEITQLNFNVNKEEYLEIKANGVEGYCHIYEDEYGTHILSSKQMCALNVLNQFEPFTYLYIDGQYITPMHLLEIANLYAQALDAIRDGKYSKESIELMHLLYRLTPGVEYYHSFLFDSTVYKIADVRKREENGQSNY